MANQMKIWKLALPVIWVLAGSCTYDKEVIPENLIECSEITYSQNVKPIIDSSCAISGCHIAGTGLPSWETLSTVQAFADEIKRRTEIRDMPRGGGVLSIDEITTIACWVDGGALDN